MAISRPRELVDLHDRDALAALRPLIIAHRGGVIAPHAPENSAAAIRLAAEQGYHLVELDVCEARDQEPVLFHGVRGGYLGVDCGVDGNVQDYTSGELVTMHYRATEEAILTLEQALALCAHHRLGVMLDFKNLEDPAADIRHTTPAFVQRSGALIRQYGLERATMTISRHPFIREHLGANILWRVEEGDTGKGATGEGGLWFGHPHNLPSPKVAELQARGRVVIPAVNNFLYPKHSFGRLEEIDIRRLVAAGVDGIQIDSIYRQYFD